jgi:membrane protein required for colicin V production
MDTAQQTALALTGFDWIVLAVVGLLAIQGLARGFTHELISLIGWVAAVLVVRLFHENLTNWFLPKTEGAASAAIVAFVLLFFGTVLAARTGASLIGGAARMSGLGSVDRVLGLGFGGLKGLILATALFLLLQFATGFFEADREPPAWLTESRTAPLLSLAGDAMVGWARALAATDEERAAARGEDTRRGLPPGLRLPPGHPSLDPYGGPGGRLGPGGGDGYSPEDRRALERLLEDGARRGDEVDI